MMDRKTLEDIVNRFYDVRAGNDKDGVLSFAGPDFSFGIVCSGKLAENVPRVCEPAALDAVVTTLVSEWDMSRMKTTRLFVDGDTVLAHRAGQLRHTPTGREMETEYIDRFTFKDGQIVDLTEFVDTLLIAETLGLAKT